MSFRKILRALPTVLLLSLACILFVRLEGIQYSLAFLTGTIQDPYFTQNLYLPSQNCYGADFCSSGVARVLTYNVLCRVCAKEEHDPWEIRIEHLRDLVEGYNPDLIETQELGGWRDIREFVREMAGIETDDLNMDTSGEFHAFEHMIDHAFLAGPVEKQAFRWIVDQNTYAPASRAASDHPAVYAELELKFPSSEL